MRASFRVIFFLFCFLWTFPVYAESLCANSCASDSGTVYHGIEYCHIQDSTHQIFILKVDLQAKGIKPFVNPKEKGMTTSKFASKYGVQVAINTAFFNGSGALGFQKSNGTVYGTDGYHAIGFDQNNKYYQGDTDAIHDLMYNATSGSPVLIKDGVKQSFSSDSFQTSKHPRTAVGADKTGRYFYMVVVDGRRTKRQGMSTSTLADCLIALGAYNGVNMDGGGSSTMVVGGKVKNSPSDGSERSVRTHLGFFADKTCTPEPEKCNNIDDDCDGQVDEDNVCCVPETEVCDGKDNDCDGQVDEDNVCCKPETEVCDGKDNDCDGQIDEDNVCCTPEVCDGKDNDCDGEVDEDNVCCTPEPEICDQKDNDCDGEIDEDNVCCVPEVCDGKDNDCDGQIDEDNICCEPEPEICDQKDNDCDGEIDEDDVCCVPEICDGKDNDCDGEIDEDGICPEECEPSEEICDQKDNDCDGEVDEDDVCNVPEGCKPSEEICDQKDNDCDGLVDEEDVCREPESCVPSEEICDGKDNDCDGKIDEGCTDSKDDSVDADVYLKSPDCSSHPGHPADKPLSAAIIMLILAGLFTLRRNRSKL